MGEEQEVAKQVDEEREETNFIQKSIEELFLVRHGREHYLADGKDRNFIFSNYVTDNKMDLFVVQWCVPHNIFLRVIYLATTRVRRLRRLFKFKKIRWVFRYPHIDRATGAYVKYTSEPFDRRTQAISHEMDYLLTHSRSRFRKQIKTFTGDLAMQTIRCLISRTNTLYGLAPEEISNQDGLIGYVDSPQYKRKRKRKRKQ